MLRIRPQVETFTGGAFEIPAFPEILKWSTSYDQVRVLPTASYMAHLRHWGFPSPLLDWSLSPYVAAYFAFARARNADVAIYAFSETPKNMKGSGSSTPTIYNLGEYIKTHPRHFRQQSSYTICVQFDAQKGWLFQPHQKVFELGRNDQDLLWKIVVPATEREKVLKHLNRFNLNEFSLFDSEESLMETLAFREIELKRPDPMPVGE